MGVSKADLVFAKREIERSRDFLEQLKENHEGEESAYSENPGSGVFLCREPIEWSVKAMLKSAGINSPDKHAIDLEHDRLNGITHDTDLPNQLRRNVLRAIFLTTSWEPYYGPARYSKRESNIHANDFISVIDVQRAIDDAEFCIDTADSFYHYQMDKNDYAVSDLDLYE